MADVGITFIIEDRTYHLPAGDMHLSADILPADRQRLIALLEKVKQQDAEAQSAIRNAVRDVGVAPRAAAASVPTGDPLDPGTIKSGRLGHGDIDNLVARLAIEERQTRKPGLTKQGLYKWIAGTTVLVLLLVFIF